MENNAAAESAVPTVDSENAEERKAARRLRIQRRVEAKRRQEMGEAGEDLDEVKQTMSEGRKQMADSYLRLMKLRDDGSEMVTNVRVAADAREVLHRTLEEEAKRTRKEKVEGEEKLAAIRFEEITKKWKSAGRKDIPQEIFEKLLHQKDLCNTMIEEKNKVIEEFRVELRMKDDEYIENLKKQAEDIDLLVERMEEQIKELSKSYRDELQNIELAFVSERTKLRSAQRLEWDITMRERDEKEQEHMRMRAERVADYERQLDELRTEDAEDYNLLKIKLEHDVQVLQQQLQMMKATYLLNQEKLEYNFQVLRKRDEENTITKSQQKRKITRYNDMLTNTKRKLEKQQKQQQEEGQQLTAEYEHMIHQFQDLQRKSRLFLSADTKKFTDIWLMNESECKQLADTLLKADRVIDEQQLGLVWETPDRKFMQNVGPLQTAVVDSDSTTAHAIAEQALTQAEYTKKQSQWQVGGADDVQGGRGASDLELTRRELLARFSPAFIKHILELLCDESGFLIEEKLHKLLAPLNQCERTLMKVDIILELLGVETEDDIKELSQYFIKFRGSESSRGQDLAGIALETRLRPHWSSTTAGKEKESGYPAEDQPAATPDVSWRPQSGLSRGGKGDKKDAATGGGVSTDSQRPGMGARVDRETGELSDDDVIDRNDVLKALRAFAEAVSLTRVKDAQRNNAIASIGHMYARNDSGDEGYWAKYSTLINSEKEQTWDALIEGFDKYYYLLKQRAKTIEETQAMRQQNVELRNLLQQYVNAKVNQELDDPPTRNLKLKIK